jgi:spectinomycin phosphotransferase
VKTEPAVDQATLIQVLRREYGVEAARLAFHPTEWGGYNYVVTCPGGARFFLKLHEDGDTVGVAASSRDFYLPLTYQLHARGILPYIPHPLLTVDGGLFARLGPYWLDLYDYIQGTVVGFGELPGPILAELARLVGILHRSLPRLDLPTLFVDDFRATFKAELLGILDRLPALPGDATPGARALRDLLLPPSIPPNGGEAGGEEQVLAHLGRMEALGALARASGKPPVVCHTDLHGGNLMVGDQVGAGSSRPGSGVSRREAPHTPPLLYILDWENAMVAPPEHDLFFFAADARFRELFLPNYEAEAGPIKLDGELLRFYYHRRGLEDLTGFCARILRGDGGATQDRSDLAEIAELLTGLASVEARVTEILQRQV